MDLLPIEIVVEIALIDPEVYRRLLKAYRRFALKTLDPQVNAMVRSRWTLRLVKGDDVLYKLFGRRHRDGDLPAVEHADGSCEWYFNGVRHRSRGIFDSREGGLPAVEYANGSCEWYFNGALHREGGLPAVEYSNGSREWWINDKQHREGDLPAVICPNGTREWWTNDKRHREGGLPAVVCSNGTREWWVNGVLHRKSHAMPADESHL